MLCSKKVLCFEPMSGQEFQCLLEFNALTGPHDKIGTIRRDYLLTLLHERVSQQDG